MKNILFFHWVAYGLLSIFLLGVIAPTVLAQEELILEAVINAPQYVEVQKNIIFDASQSKFEQEKGDATYSWDLGDGTYIAGEEIVHTYERPGQYIVKLNIEQGEERHTTETILFAYQRIVVLITSLQDPKSQENIFRLVEDAKKSGTQVKLIDSSSVAIDFSSEEILSKQLIENKDSLQKAKTIIYWPERTVDFSVLTSFYQQTQEDKIDYSQKTFVFISEERLQNIIPFAQSTYNLFQSSKVLITRKEAINPILVASSEEEYIQEMENRFIETETVDETSGRWNILKPFASLTRYMLENGIPSNMIILILMLPIIATIVAFFRQIIGLTTFGVYTPSVIAISFIALGFKFGFIILLITIAAGAITRNLLSKFRLLHIPKIAIVFTGSSLTIFLTIALAVYFNITDFATMAIFPMLIMLTLGEKFYTMQTGKGFLTAFVATTETVIVSLACYFIATWEFLQTYVINYPGWMFLIIILINISLGRFTGLRVREYFRFRAIFDSIQE